MSRTYRPRLSKDKAVAQRVGEQLERELLGVDSLERQIAAFKRIEDSHTSSQSQKSDDSSNDAVAPTLAAPAATTAVTKPKAALKRKRAATTRNIPESTGSNSSGSNSSSSNKVETTGRNSDGDCSTSARGAGSFPQSLANGNDGEQTEKGQWACPSCSFLNREAATKCSICKTKHYPPSAASRGASGRVRGTVVTETRTRRRGRLALRSDGEACSSSGGRKTEVVLSEAKTDSEKDDGHTVGQSKRRRSTASKSANVGAAARVESEETDNVGRRRRQRNINRENVDRATAPVTVGRAATSDCLEGTPRIHRQTRSREAAQASLQPVLVSHPDLPPITTFLVQDTPGPGSERESDQRPEPLDRRRRRDTRRNLSGAEGLARGSQRKGSTDDFTSRLLPKTAPSKQAKPLNESPTYEAAEVEVTACSERSGEHGTDINGNTASVVAESECKAVSASSGDRTETVATATAGAQQSSSHNAKVREEKASILVTPSTHEEKGAKCTTPSMRSDVEQCDTSARPEVASFTASSAATISPFKSVLPGGRPRASWPLVSQAATLDFTGRSMNWGVSSVVVTRTNPQIIDTAAAESPTDGVDVGGDAAIIICHFGGVSVWGLTDAAAVCTHLSPGLAGETTEKARVRFHAASVVGGGDGTNDTRLAVLARIPQTFIVAVGRHELDPGPPVIRVWEGSWLGKTTNLGLGAKPRGMEASSAAGPAMLTAVLKKKFASFFPPMAPKSAAPCLCICEYSTVRAGRENEEKAQEAGRSAKITMVMALGGKAVRLVCAPGRRGSEEIRAKSLPTGAVGNTAVFTSLAAVPTNTSLVWAAIPSSNAVLLWDTEDLQLLFTLPLTASSICVPVAALPQSLTARDEGQASDKLVSSAQRRAMHAHLESRLLCVLATAGTSDRGGRSRGSASARTNSCEFFGICCGWCDGGDTGGVVSALRLGASDEPEAVVVSAATASGESAGRCCETGEYSPGTPLECLSDGGGFVAGIGGAGTVIARDVLSGDSCVLVATDPADNVCFSSIGCDRNVGAFAVAIRAFGCNDSAAVALYVLSSAPGHTDRADRRPTSR